MISHTHSFPAVSAATPAMAMVAQPLGVVVSQVRIALVAVLILFLNELQELETEIRNNADAIKELEASPRLTWIEQEELDRLREAERESR